MAVKETGEIFKGVIFDGESSKTYGVYITGEAVFNSCRIFLSHMSRDIRTV